MEDRPTFIAELRAIDRSPAEDSSELNIIDEPPADDTSELHIIEGSPTEVTSDPHTSDGSYAEDISEVQIIDGSSADDTSELHIIEGSPTEVTSDPHTTDGSSAEVISEVHIIDGSFAEDTSDLHLIDSSPVQNPGDLYIDGSLAEDSNELHIIDICPPEDISEVHTIDGSPVEDIELHVDDGSLGEEPQVEPDSTDTETALDKSSILGNSSVHLSSNVENIPKISQPNPTFLKPFKVGWKREMVFRNPTCDSNRRRVDVYYYTPSGKKLRSLKNIAEHLEGTNLTLENFTFTRMSLGIDDPEKELVRNAKRSSSGGSFRVSKKSRRESSDPTGTPRVVFKNCIEVGDNDSTVGENCLNEETCSWLPPMWGKLLSILNRKC